MSRAREGGTSDAIAITGAGAVTPLGTDRAAFEAALRARDAAEMDAPPATRIEGFDAGKLPESKSLRRATAHALFGVAATGEALREAERAGSGGATPEEGALVFASTLGSTNFSWKLWRELLDKGPLGASPVLFSEGVPNAVAGHVARCQRLLGAGHMLGGGGDVGLRALAVARDLLAAKRARRVVAGAAEELSEIATLGYQRLGVAARARKPGSKRGTTRGRALVPAEGAAALVLERAADLAGRRPLARLLAVECAQLPRAPRARAAETDALVELIERAVRAAGVASRDVAWLGSAANGATIDALEEAALARLAPGGFAPERSRRTRRALGDAFSATPLLQAIEALPVVAEGRIAAVLAVSLFGAATTILLAP
jgi:3-oxoacyl-[acyl-carrier-protein] synthase II